MIRLILILFFLFARNGTPLTTAINMKNQSFIFGINYEKSGNSKIIKTYMSNEVHRKSLILHKNNPGNLKSFKTGRYKVFKTLEAGYSALLYDLNLKIIGRSLWTDSTTTIHDFISIYANGSIKKENHKYIKIFCSETGLQPTDLLNTQNAELVAQGIIKVENGDLYHQLYSTKKD